MKKIVLNGDYAFIYLNKSFYNKRNIVQTIKVYEEFIEAKISQLGKYHVIRISLKDEKQKLSEISHEFLNYTLSLENHG